MTGLLERIYLTTAVYALLKCGQLQYYLGRSNECPSKGELQSHQAYRGVAGMEANKIWKVVDCSEIVQVTFDCNSSCNFGC